MHIREFNEEVTDETLKAITKMFMNRFWSETATYTQQARTSALPPKMLQFIQASLKTKGEWLSYDSDSDTCRQ
jgi:hypothetical protein